METEHHFSGFHDKQKKIDGCQASLELLGVLVSQVTEAVECGW